MKKSITPAQPQMTPIVAAPTMPRPLALRIPEVQRMTGLGRTKLYALIADGELATIKIGRATLIPLASLEALLERGQQHRP
ncbi:helix-turn-helix domain-containing protein [Novosphingobium sp. KACC 22771]|uniref:helix-turn-helix domain-containing protein n=1 Tax=Novosphingobium sp. KACC 22771 TaxID=3025670 RepID=UPI002366CA12|nr:helix-turn-helix domain-containing protein [Novosphingobium sp. KACC 22771]WDF72258.1 helix-turn-helix domain-containing protein [Novosphingobium sp. KACC 22771]